MNKRFRLSVILAAAVTALSLGLTAASASGAPTAPPSPPAGSAPAAVAADTPPQQHFSPHPPSRTESVYVAVAPCRILDTRNAGGKMANGATRTFFVGGTTQFLSQGGKAGGCGIPLSATAIAASIGATNTANSGYLTAWPADLARPTASNLNYTKGQTIASGGNISVQKNVAASLKIANNGGPTDVFVDVTGYYAQQIEGMVSPTGQIYSGSDRLVSATPVSPGVTKVTFDSDVTYCTPMIDTYSGRGVYGSAYAFSGKDVYVNTWYLNSTTHLEVPLSYYFYITVTC